MVETCLVRVHYDAHQLVLEVSRVCGIAAPRRQPRRATLW